MPKLNWLYSLLASAGLSTMIALPVNSQALLPYIPDLNSEKLEQQGISLAQDALQLLRFGRYQSALPRAQLATQLAPDVFQTWLILGNLYLQQEEVDEGIRALKIANALAPEEAGIYFSLGSAYFQKDDYEGAVEQLNKGIAIEPESPVAFFDLGNSYLMLNRNSKAIESYQKAVDLDDKFWPAINNIGLVQYEDGDIDEAISSWEASITIDNQQSEPQLALAVALYHQGQEEDALKIGEQALNRDPRYADLEFLRKNLWGSRLLNDTQTFLETPTIQALLARLEEQPPEMELNPISP